MYDMYSWDPADDHAEAPRPGRNGRAHRTPASAAPAAPAPAESRPAQAVQMALDRRDNGGDTGRTR